LSLHKIHWQDTVCRVKELLNPKKSFVQTINEIFSNSNEREQQESSNDDNSTRRSENDPEKNDKVFDTASSAEGEQLISKAK
jgi:Mn-containing catalase